ncbi:prephenate dehydratase [Bryobacterales bacterium F-183]|nr:prephenate dehydratase [Bryobacterales bacterium F-183]
MTKTKKKKKERAAFQGERGAFSQQAILNLLGPDAELAPYERFEEAFRALQKGDVTCAVIPFENTLHGSVHENYDHILNFNMQIEAETSVRIVHNLIACPGVPFSKIKTVYSHPVALNQCLDFFRNNPQVSRTTYYDTAGSVKMVLENKLPDAAAIASSLAAEIYGGRILKKGIEDDHQNFTRFFLLRPQVPKRRFADDGKDWKTSIVFTTRNSPGSLFRSLAVFALRDISLAKIESRPHRGKPWEYLFYLDLHAHVEEERVQNALGHLTELADMIRILGCYPKGF